MAFLDRQDEDEQAQGMNTPQDQAQDSQQQEQDQQQSQAPIPVGANTGASSAPSSSSTANKAPSTTPNAKAGSGLFTNLNRYIDANKGNRIASSASQNIKSSAEAVRKGIQQGSAAFGEKVEQGSLKNRDTAVQDVRTAAQQARNLNAPLNAIEQPKNTGTQVLQDLTPKPSQASQASQTPTPPPGVTALETEPLQTTEPIGQEQPSAPPVSVENPAMTAQDLYGNILQDVDTKRFQDVINAQYEGPKSLRQAGIFDPLQDRVQTTQNRLDQTRTASGREDLLTDLFGRNREYTRGQNKLDSLLLNTSEEGIDQLAQAREGAGNLQQRLQDAQNESQNFANARKQEIARIAQDARGAFTEEQQAEIAQTNEYLDNIEAEWNTLPEYYKDIIRNSSDGPIDFNDMEMAVLGIRQGDGFYNLGENAIKTGVRDNEKLITRDQQLRQAALAELASLDRQNLLNDNLMYADASKAGTQNIFDSLDTGGTRDALTEAEKQFRQEALNTMLVGRGSKKVSRGNMFGKKTKTYHSEVRDTAANLLRELGYDVNEDNVQEMSMSLLDRPDLMQNLGLTTASSEVIGGEGGAPVLTSAAAGAGTGASLGSAIPGVGTAIGAAAGGAAGAALGANSLDANQIYVDVLRELGLSEVADTMQGVRNTAGDIYDRTAGGILDGLGLGFVGSGIGGAISGIDTNAMRDYGTGLAKQFAGEDLKNKFENFLQNQGFENRARLSNPEEAQQNVDTIQNAFNVENQKKNIVGTASNVINENDRNLRAAALSDLGADQIRLYGGENTVINQVLNDPNIPESAKILLGEQGQQIQGQIANLAGMSSLGRTDSSVNNMGNELMANLGVTPERIEADFNQAIAQNQDNPQMVEKLNRMKQASIQKVQDLKKVADAASTYHPDNLTSIQSQLDRAQKTYEGAQEATQRQPGFEEIMKRLGTLVR